MSNGNLAGDGERGGVQRVARLQPPASLATRLELCPAAARIIKWKTVCGAAHRRGVAGAGARWGKDVDG